MNLKLTNLKRFFDGLLTLSDACNWYLSRCVDELLQTTLIDNCDKILLLCCCFAYFWHWILAPWWIGMERNLHHWMTWQWWMLVWCKSAQLKAWHRCPGNSFNLLLFFKRHVLYTLTSFDFKCLLNNRISPN